LKETKLVNHQTTLAKSKSQAIFRFCLPVSTFIKDKNETSSVHSCILPQTFNHSNTMSNHHPVRGTVAINHIIKNSINAIIIIKQQCESNMPVVKHRRKETCQRVSIN